MDDAPARPRPAPLDTLGLTRHEIRRPGSAPAGRPEGRPRESIAARVGRIQDNLTQNSSMLTEHRRALGEVTLARQQRAMELAQNPTGGGSALGAAHLPCGDPHAGFKSLKLRTAQLLENVDRNQEVMDSHRQCLDEAAAAREEKAGRLDRIARGLTASTASPLDEDGSTPPHREVTVMPEYDAFAMAAAAEDEAQAAVEAAEKRRLLFGAGGPEKAGEHAMHKLRPQSAPGCARRAGKGFYVPQMPARQTRPHSAAPAVPTYRGSRVSSSTTAAMGGIRSRPVSAGSMRARCNALTKNARKNHEQIQTHRGHLDDVVRSRKEQAERMDAMVMAINEIRQVRDK